MKESLIHRHLSAFPAVALLGARQVGKSTLVKKVIETVPDAVYLDLEDPRDYAKLQEPQIFLEANKQHMICFDEVQRYPEIFQLLRSHIDTQKRPGQFLLLGSASRDLIRQSSETLAGRISFIEISPFIVSEIEDIDRLWLQGGYPVSYSLDTELSFDWRINYIRTFLERDIPQLGITVPAETLRRFWTMLAHLNGNIVNYSSIAASMGLSSPTIKRYFDILEGTFIIRRLQPYFTNTKKRLVKSPKLYIRDTGLTHCLLGIETVNDLLGHPGLGSSYEACILSSIIERYPRYTPSYYRSSSGVEVDLIMERGNRRFVFEIKVSPAPKIPRGFYEALKAIEPERAFVIAPVDSPYPVKDNIMVYPIRELLNELDSLLE